MSIQEWQRFSQSISARASAVDRSIHERGWRLAATVGIPRCGCSLHNASIDDSLSGWCFRNPERLKVAKRANYLVNQWPAARIAERIISRAYSKVEWPER